MPTTRPNAINSLSSSTKSLLITWLTLLCLALIACDEKPVKAIQPASEQVVSVNVIALQLQRWSQDINTFGSLESTEEVSISIDYTGTVDEIHFDEGQNIKAGQVLVRMDDSKQQLRLKQATANADGARAQLERTQSTYNRHRSLVADNLLSKERFKLSQAEFESAKAGLQQAVAAQSLAQQELKQTVIIAAVDGIVKSRNVEVGQTVLPGTSLGVVQVTDTMRVVTYVTEREVNSLRIGDQATMTTPGIPGRIYAARIALIGSSADPRSGNFTVKLAVNNEQGLLRQGMSARIKLSSIQQNDVLLLPRAAMVDRNRRRVVYTAVNGRAKEIEPVLGVSSGELMPVLAGLQAGDQVIVDRLDLIINDKPIELVISENTNAHNKKTSSQPGPQEQAQAQE